jgi:glyoxylase-like metal-dependent hydrolase (beta-lactamase superfamily II)/predicted Fe-S protein YdhL (DUF1289 family)
MDPRTGLCEGCLRTIDEIAAWSSMTEDNRGGVIAAIEARGALLRMAEPATIAPAVTGAQDSQKGVSDPPRGDSPSTVRFIHLEWPATLRFIQRDWLSCNSVLICDRDAGATLFDSGYVKHEVTTREVLARHLGDQPLRRLVNTHLHSDHCGGNALLQRTYGCAIAVPRASWKTALAWDEELLTYRATGQRCPRFRPDASLAPGDVLDTGELRWEVHSAPGHDPHSIVLFEPQHRLLISADALWAEGFGVIFPELEGESGFAEQEAMLNTIAGLTPRWVFPGHGPAFNDVERAIAFARKRLAALRSDKARNARHALKVLIKFLLLDLEFIHVDALHAHLADARLFDSAAHLAGMDRDAALLWAVQALCSQGLAGREGELLHNRTDAKG